MPGSTAIVKDGFCKPREAAKYLHVSPRWLYELVRIGALSHVRHGRSITIPWAAVYAYAASRLNRGYVA